MSGEDTNAIQNYFRKEATVPTGGVKEFESTYFKSQPVNELNLKKELAGNVDVTCSECAENKLDCESYDELTCKHHTIKEQCNDPIMNLNSKHQHQLKSSELVDLQLRETPDPNTSEVTNLPNYISIHTKVEFFVITKDGNGEHCSKGGHNVTVELRSSADHVTSLEVRDNHDGSYVALLEGKKIGEAELHVSIDGRFIMGNPYSITFRNYHAVKLPSKTVNNNGGMGKPWGIAFGRNGIWAITDYSNHCVHVFDGQDQLINSFGNRGNKTSQFINPHGIAFDESNHMYVVDNNNHRVQKFDVSGSYLLHFGGYGSDDGELQYPLGVKAHNGRIYVSEWDSSRISVFQYNGYFSFSFGSDQLDYPFGLVVNVNNQLLVTDCNLHCIARFTLDGHFIDKFGTHGFERGHLNYPCSIATDENGLVYVGDGNHRVSMFDSVGNFIHCFGPQGSANGKFHYLYGIDVSPNGSIYVADSDNKRIQIFADY